MATRAATVVIGDDGAGTVTWSGLLNGDDGAGVDLTRYSDKSLQVTGTFGVGGSLTMEGSEDGGTTYGGLNDPQGAAIAQTDSSYVLIAESPSLLRPRVTAGDGATNLVARVAFVVRGK